MSMGIEQKLAANKFVVDEGHPHITIHADKLDEAARRALTMACPAGLYTLNGKGELVFECAGCLECGACRVLCARLPGALEWNHPQPGFGIQYRFG